MPATYEPIATTTLTVAASTITFNSIPGTYTDLRIILRGITATADGSWNIIRLNNSGTSLYSYLMLNSNGTTATRFRGWDTAYCYLNRNNSSGVQPYLQTVDIFSYTGSTNKPFLSTSAMDRNGAGLSNVVVGLWRDTAVVTRVDLIVDAYDNFQPGTTATLFGIKAA